MRNISFKLTTQQFRDQTKTVTRRLAWEKLKVGTQLMGCEQCQGIKAGQLVRLGGIVVVSIRREPLYDMLSDEEYGELECIREGFPDMKPREFVEMFCDNMKCDDRKPLARIEYDYLEVEADQCPRCFARNEKAVIHGSDEVYCPQCRAIWTWRNPDGFKVGMKTVMEVRS